MVVLGKKTDIEPSGAVLSKVADVPIVVVCEWGLLSMLGIDVHGDAQGQCMLLEGA